MLHEFLEPGRRSERALVLTGGPGIGKTTLWEAGIEAAQASGRRLLSARPSSAEAGLPFAALIDLCETLELSEIPTPQRVALEVALLRAEPQDTAPEPHAIALGFLNAVGNFTSADAVNLVLGRPAHPAFLISELWNEFIVAPPDLPTLGRLISTYTSGGMQLKPLLALILTNSALFDSLDEPNMIKPPVVYVVGAMRALGETITDTTAADFLDGMGQVPYFPPNVSGWEGGLSWLNTNTALARFSFVSALLSGTTITDVPGETAAAAYDRAYAAAGRPWLAPGTQNALSSFA